MSADWRAQYTYACLFFVVGYKNSCNNDGHHYCSFQQWSSLLLTITVVTTVTSAGSRFCKTVHMLFVVVAAAIVSGIAVIAVLVHIRTVALIL